MSRTNAPYFYSLLGKSKEKSLNHNQIRKFTISYWTFSKNRAFYKLEKSTKTIIFFFFLQKYINLFGSQNLFQDFKAEVDGHSATPRRPRFVLQSFLFNDQLCPAFPQTPPSPQRQPPATFLHHSDNQLQTNVTTISKVVNCLSVIYAMTMSLVNSCLTVYCLRLLFIAIPYVRIIKN